MGGGTISAEKKKPFQEREVTLQLHLSPAHLGNVAAGVIEHLNRSLLRCASAEWVVGLSV